MNSGLKTLGAKIAALGLVISAGCAGATSQGSAGAGPESGGGSAEERVPRLISTDALAEMLVGQPPTILDVRPGWPEYLQNHLPGAEWLNSETLRATEAGLPFQLLPAESYRVIFSRLGLVPGRAVVVYSAGESQDIDATFVAWLLDGFGHYPVYVLDGGYGKWDSENRPLTQRYPRIVPSTGASSPFKGETAVLADVQQAVRQRGALLVDARSPEQFAGRAGAQRRRGHIPGAVNHPWKDDLERRDLAVVWKPLDALRVNYQDQGITPERDIIVYCNTGTEASHVFFALRYLLQYPRVRIYTGSWSQWAEREDLPIASESSGQ